MKILAILSFVLLLLIQLTLVDFLTIGLAIPNLILTLCLSLVILRGFDKIWWIYLISAFFLDLYADLPFGIISLSLILSLYLVDLSYRKIFSLNKFWSRLILGLIGISLYYFFVFTGSLVFEINLIFNFKILISCLAYNLVLMIFFIYAIQKIFYQKKTKRNY